MGPLKRCSTCHVLQPLTAFNRRRSSADGLQARCRDCSRAWYRANAVEHKRHTAARSKQQRVLQRQRLAAHLLQQACVDCGEDDVRVLEFDHRDPSQKRSSVAAMMVALCAWELVLAEIAKCDVRCANCHRRRTQDEGVSWRNAAERERQEAEHDLAVARLRRVLPART